jgi:hypothetical protein
MVSAERLWTLSQQRDLRVLGLLLASMDHVGSIVFPFYVQRPVVPFVREKGAHCSFKV